MGNIKPALIYLFIGLAFVVGGAWISNWINGVSQTPTTPTIVSRPIVDCPNDSNSFLATQASTTVVLLQNRQSYGKAGDGFPVAYNVSLKRASVQSKIACGYLHFIVSVGNRPLQSWEDFYMLPTDSTQFGGHIILDPKNAIPLKSGTKTDVVYPLDDVEFRMPNGTRSWADWSALLNVSDNISFTIALNTTDQSGKIDLVEIAYKCWNPQTGVQTNDCGLATSSIQQISN